MVSSTVKQIFLFKLMVFAGSSLVIINIYYYYNGL